MITIPAVVPPISASAHHAEDDGDGEQGVVDLRGRQAGDDRLAGSVRVHRDHAVAAQTVELNRPGRVIRFERAQLLCCGGTDLAASAVGGDDAGVDGRAARDHRADRSGRLTGRVEESRAWSQVVADDHPSRKARRPGKPGGGGGGPNSNRPAERLPVSASRSSSWLVKKCCSAIIVPTPIPAHTRASRRTWDTSNRVRSDHVRGERNRVGPPLSVRV